MHKKILTTFLICAPMSAVANIPSTEYVQQQIASQIATAVSSKADTSATANQVGDMYYNATGLSDYSSIPSAWK